MWFIFYDILKYVLYRVFFFIDNNIVLGVKERYEMYKILKYMFLEKLYYVVFIFWNYCMFYRIE